MSRRRLPPAARSANMFRSTSTARPTCRQAGVWCASKSERSRRHRRASGQGRRVSSYSRRPPRDANADEAAAEPVGGEQAQARQGGGDRGDVDRCSHDADHRNSSILSAGLKRRPPTAGPGSQRSIGAAAHESERLGTGPVTSSRDENGSLPCCHGCRYFLLRIGDAIPFEVCTHSGKMYPCATILGFVRSKKC